ncbi:hypothetical protein [Nocardia huaxiensis]|uniref:Uncharacterized protein n=1 Tax=Nocardia huaxiensis TaxID=2755382 RepID=A0A7D6ZC33_9NOCA|nr:hypothetical protein [Nocardia huaxiensis]QLY31848.1 hypothetical protein H0264_05940 [Nocardia huaxiensis]UFS95413.1 hypothetical protein LPY97_32810 [Nocardia huaxiensis]
MRFEHPSEPELRANFEAELRSALAGEGLHSDTGLDDETSTALRSLAAAFPNVTQQLVDAARAAFAGQLDGSNARAADELLDRMIAEHNRRHSASE